MTILVGFALPPLLQLKRVPPARVLRRNLEPPPLRYAAVYLFAIGAVLALLYWLVRDARLVSVVAAGIGGTFLALGARRLAAGAALAPLRRGVGVAWRYGLANIARRGRDSVVQIVAFGLGLMVLLLLALVRNDLLQDWRASLPADAPNYFMINIRPDEGAAIDASSSASGACRRPSWCRWCARGSRRSTTCRSDRSSSRATGRRASSSARPNLTWAARCATTTGCVRGQLVERRRRRRRARLGRSRSTPSASG